MDILKIRSFLPHRYPFLLVDRVLEVGEDRVVGYKNVTINEPFFVGHFPEEPVMPGVLVLESMGQVAAMMIATKPEAKGLAMYLTGIEKAKLRKPVVPGDKLVTEAKLVRLRGKVGKVEAVAKVEGEVVAEALFSFVVAERLTGEKD
ncbi:3-hydroxyacyl-(acyl-carrier-protein) dehydratase [Thermovirga lienii DSM 17291]|uniref:3-hydroxyacyl-[acyl-carrier-protein] dehydratase FabZ n=1 Tax=Thermovirga lienii (strain ATCC BAA-1197 / DSM 17291 / Cas60314) TaxID=580340 RepID=G7V8C2_THELD|nr:3-hydroxyacyl-ACP dehydratase FabZ [Thermovirga lienii]MDN5319413.1 3-hydroxyacyl-[acyl-carrier-protein] dehydratase [Thermovirga sp.]AER66284.1 3-hydroxyacyl-(acyl-carrier-protein) dehydratase [Thermovirga lienii DSM 17291]KUK42185.1 MAG: 3-hydroxyacyl-[acyl-carrier-protein] dehydratase FabZ [Thermovirga lienii]MDN5368091.1 3-hydroxyacyl-[acyl-carrier-protein] dehydratase [Thermovirga sp.]HCD71738.1 3-hydroxyacyl-[acyl-carrier-protein] dehydratase FabZ [Thermovirga lienii]